MLWFNDGELQFIELSLADHAGEVLEFFERNHDYFITVENTSPSPSLVEETFTSLP